MILWSGPPCNCTITINMTSFVIIFFNSVAWWNPGDGCHTSSFKSYPEDLSYLMPLCIPELLRKTLNWRYLEVNFKENLPSYTFAESAKAFLGLNANDTVRALSKDKKGVLLNAFKKSILDRVCKLNLLPIKWKKWIEALYDQPVLKMKILLVPVDWSLWCQSGRKMHHPHWSQDYHFNVVCWI